MPTPTITFSPNVSTYTTGNSPITVSISGGVGPAYLWESNSGSFTDKFAASPAFTPKNATSIVNVIGRRVTRTLGTGSGAGSIASSGINGGLIKTGLSSSNWDAAMTSLTGLVSTNGFFECNPTDATTEKALGLLLNANYRDPNTVHATNAFQLCWHLYSNGTAVPRKLGTALSNVVVYKASDIFRVSIIGTIATFTINSLVVATCSVPAGNLYACVSFKTIGAVLDNPSFLIDTTNNEGNKTLSVVGLFPVQPNYTYDHTEDSNTLTSEAEDGSITSRIKGIPKRTLNLQFVERPYSEYVLLKDFWRAHQKFEKFVYSDVIYGEVYLMRFDAGLRTQIQAPDSITIQLSLKEV